MSPESEDEAIIGQIIAGDTRAFETLITRYQDVVSRFIFKVVPNQSDREEVCQDVFLKVYTNLHQFRFDAKFTTWLYQIAYRSAVSFNRRKRFETFEYEDEYPAAELTDPVNEQQVRQILDRELNQLKLEERTVVTLHYLQDLTIDEISQIVERPSGTIKSILYRVRQKLHDSLQRREPSLSEAV